MNSATCHHCSKTFYNVSTKNRHMRSVHLLVNEITDTRNRHIFCTLCSDDQKKYFSTYFLLMQHITDVHKVNFLQEKLYFSNYNDFETWRALEKRNLNYIIGRVGLYNNKKVIHYNCKRSNSAGFKSKCTQRSTKKSGSIKINGVCPSRIIVRVSKKGKVAVDFIKTHIGHVMDCTGQRLTRKQQDVIGAKLKAGISADKIISDAKEMKGNESERIDFLTKRHLRNLRRKFNIKRSKGSDNTSEEHKTEDTVGEKLKQEFEPSGEKLILKEVTAESIVEKNDNLSNNVKEEPEEDVDEAMYRKSTLQTATSMLDTLNYETYKKAICEINSILKIYSENSSNK